MFCSSHWFVNGECFKSCKFFTDETKRVVLTCIRLETGSNIHYFWSFTMHSLSSPNFFLRPWCTSTPFYSKRARHSLHLSDISMGYILKRGNFFPDETKKAFLTFLRLETSSNIHYFWSFTMHSISSSIFFLWPRCTSTPFYSKRARHSLHLSDKSIGYILKRGSFFRDETKKIVFNLSTLRNKFQDLLLLKFHHALIIFIELLFAALVHFYSVLLEESKTFSSSQRYIHGVYFKERQFFPRWDQKTGFNLSTLRKKLQHLPLLKVSPCTQNLHQISFWGSGALLLRFTLREQDILFISVIHLWGIFKKEAFFPQMRLKKWF